MRSRLAVQQPISVEDVPRDQLVRQEDGVEYIEDLVFVIVCGQFDSDDGADLRAGQRMMDEKRMLRARYRIEKAGLKTKLKIELIGPNFFGERILRFGIKKEVGFQYWKAQY